MNDNNKVGGLINITTEKLKGLVDTDTVIGDPVTVGDLTLIPVSKTTFGVAAGGSDIPTKHDGDFFGGGSGAGASVTPVAFLAVKNGETKIIPINQSNSSVDRAISLVPDLFDKVSGFFAKKKDKNK